MAFIHDNKLQALHGSGRVKIEKSDVRSAPDNDIEIDPIEEKKIALLQGISESIKKLQPQGNPKLEAMIEKAINEIRGSQPAPQPVGQNASNRKWKFTIERDSKGKMKSVNVTQTND
jgi:hypothetical protein